MINKIKLKYYLLGLILLLLSFSFNFDFANALTCGGVQTSVLSCGSGSTDTLGGVGAILKTAVTILTYIIGGLAVAGLVYAGILYTTAGGNAEQTKKAISYIRNVILGILVYAVMQIALVWLVPGYRPF